MNRNPLNLALATVLLGSLALAGCKKNEEAVPAPVTVEPAPTPMVTPTVAPAATISVASVDLGNAAGADLHVLAPMTSFGKNDTIVAAIATTTSDPAVAVTGKLGVKWTDPRGQVFNDESRDINFTGPGVTDFQVAKPGGWPAGNYKLEVSLDGSVVQSKDFSIK